ncbi:hypothetical protein [Caulobacter soli]|uniref:hypothetical protein n=1 Tax=Caulobacter soli TaxID=2708539 RepID=UPI0013EC8AB0|nr:hypothetical protein [Caulobacter soli]
MSEIALPTKPCRACCYDMPAKANKCVKCSSLQDWQRYLTFSSSILALLTALVSVSTFAIPIWKSAFAPSIVPFISVNRMNLDSFLVSIGNDGASPMAIKDFFLELRGQGDLRITVPLQVTGNNGQLVVDGNKNIAATLVFMESGDSNYDKVLLERINSDDNLSSSGTCSIVGGFSDLKAPSAVTGSALVNCMNAKMMLRHKFGRDSQ